jgi:misacylated tRNA(Ala) deacylase
LIWWVDLVERRADAARMTTRLFLEDSAATGMKATVVSVSPAGITLDQTVFYARSGGQPGDSGVLLWDGQSIEITEAIKGDGESILHVPQSGAVLPEVGETVTGTIDWAKRHALMRMHTALHLLCAALPGVSVTGGSIGAVKSRLDFDMADPPARETLEEKLQTLIDGDYAIAAFWVDENVLDTNPSLVRTLSVQPPRGTGRLRLVRIGSEEAPVDLQPCGGTHVSRTLEIGAVRITKIENKGRQNRRISLEFAP